MFYISGTGKAIPSNTLSNDDLASYLETDDEWITTRTGIKNRRIIEEGTETTSSLAIIAARQALSNANIQPSEIDCVIVATSSPSQPMPSTANLVAQALEIKGPGFDLNAACSGFVYALNVAAGLFAVNKFNNVLLIGADAISTYIDKNDRSTVILFGDGAGAVVLSETDDEQAGLIACDMGGDSSLVSILEVIHNGDTGREPCLVMNGQEVFKVAVRSVEKSIKSTLEKANISGEDIDGLFLHQANIRIIDAICERLDIDRKKAFTNLEQYGNTSAASIPILLAEVNESNRLKAEDLLVFCGFGAGMSWGTCILRWKKPNNL